MLQNCLTWLEILFKRYIIENIDILEQLDCLSTTSLNVDELLRRLNLLSLVLYV